MLKDNREYMVAFSTNNLLCDTPEDIASATDFTNDKIGIVLKALDPSRIDQDVVDILVGMTSMRVRWQNGDYSGILLNKAQVMGSVETPLWRIIAVSAMALIFLLPQISWLIVRRIPEYADNLCNLLLLTVERSSALEGMSSMAKNIGILLSTDDNEAGRTALLSTVIPSLLKRNRQALSVDPLMKELLVSMNHTSIQIALCISSSKFKHYYWPLMLTCLNDAALSFIRPYLPIGSGSCWVNLLLWLFRRLSSNVVALILLTSGQPRSNKEGVLIHMPIAS